MRIKKIIYCMILTLTFILSGCNNNSYRLESQLSNSDINKKVEEKDIFFDNISSYNNIDLQNQLDFDTEEDYYNEDHSKFLGLSKSDEDYYEEKILKSLDSSFYEYINNNIMNNGKLSDQNIKSLLSNLHRIEIPDELKIYNISIDLGKEINYRIHYHINIEYGYRAEHQDTEFTKRILKLNHTSTLIKDNYSIQYENYNNKRINFNNNIGEELINNKEISNFMKTITDDNELTNDISNCIKQYLKNIPEIKNIEYLEVKKDTFNNSINIKIRYKNIINNKETTNELTLIKYFSNLEKQS